MRISLYCKNKGMDLAQYKRFQKIVKDAALAIVMLIKQNYKTGTGMYYSINDIIAFNSDPDIKCFMIQELKQIGVEFIENDSMWRY